MKNKDDLIKYIYDWIKEEAAIDNLNENIVVDKYGIQID